MSRIELGKMKGKSQGDMLLLWRKASGMHAFWDWREEGVEKHQHVILTTRIQNLCSMCFSTNASASFLVKRRYDASKQSHPMLTH